MSDLFFEQSDLEYQRAYDKGFVAGMRSGLSSLPKSNAMDAKEFTEGSTGKQCPLRPTFMDVNEIRFILRMVLSEMAELVRTVIPEPDKALQFVHDCVGADLKPNYKPISRADPDYEAKMCAEQYDAFVDAWYYMLNAACKKGCNLSKLFDAVHQANMNKRQPDGSWLLRADGKVDKPKDWKEADIVAAIKDQTRNGAW